MWLDYLEFREYHQKNRILLKSYKEPTDKEDCKAK